MTMAMHNYPNAPGDAAIEIAVAVAEQAVQDWLAGPGPILTNSSKEKKRQEDFYSAEEFLAQFGVLERLRDMHGDRGPLCLFAVRSVPYGTYTQLIEDSGKPARCQNHAGSTSNVASVDKQLMFSVMEAAA
jgi:hypothetical protein